MVLPNELGGEHSLGSKKTNVTGVGAQSLEEGGIDPAWKELRLKVNVKPMKYIQCFLLFIAIAVLPGTVWSQSNAYHVEGLFYLDHSPVRIGIRDGRISGITRLDALSDDTRRLYISPGLIDNQVNGYNGIPFVSEGEELTLEEVQIITEGLWKTGVTTYLPTLRTNDQKVLLQSLAVLAKARSNPALNGSIPGFHLEGPYISPVDGFRGAHALKSVRKPNWKEFTELYEAAGGAIVQVTLAPEVDGALDFITRCRERNIVVALGHHNASTRQVTEAVDRGAQTVTHLGNAMANTINRHVNPLWSQLADDRLMISMIADGFHLLPEQIRVFYKAKGVDRTIITSDVTRYAGMRPGKYLNAEGDTIQLTEDGAAIYVARNSLSGSASPISKGVGFVMKVTGCSLAEAIQMASSNPAELYGLKDRGELMVGMRADLILFDMDDFKMDIRKTIVNGKVVYEAKN